MTGLKQKTINGLFWSFIDNFANLGIQFIAGIILARILSPREFGLVGMITIFIAVSQTFIDSGFSQALIRKQKCTQTDYSTVFYFNLAVASFMFIALFFSASSISHFFNEPELKPLVQVLGLGLLISSFTIIQHTILTKEINFKLQTKISIIASIGSGIIGIGMALNGFGVWSLVARTLAMRLFSSLLLWIWIKWKPILQFSTASFKELFGFGSKLLVSGLIDTLYRNIYLLVIGKYFSASELGYYTRAVGFNNLPSQNITNVIQRVSYPVLSSIQDDPIKLLDSYRKLIKATMFITFTLMLGLAAAAKPVVLTLVGEKWLPSVIYLQLLCFVGMLFPLHALNLNMLQVKGRSDLFLRLEIIKKIIAVPVIVLGILTSIKIMIIGMIFISIIALYLNSYYSGKLIGYSFKEQVKDILPSFLIASFVAVIIYFTGQININNNLVILVLEIFVGAIMTFIMGEIFKLKEYVLIKELLLNYRNNINS